MADINKSKRVAGQEVVEQPPIYLPKGHPDLAFLDPRDVVVTNGTKPSIKYFTVNNPFDVPADAPPPEDIAGYEDAKSNFDLFDLSSIEGEPVLVKKYDSVTGALTYWVTLKIRNTSVSPENVKGVDARIYVPGS